MRTRPLAWLSSAVLVAALFASVVGTHAQAAPEDAIRYVYDDAGRLKAVSDPASQTATYTWDAVGNLLSLRRLGSMSLSVIQASPSRGEVGQQVTVYGTGFRTAATDNAVKFNGTPTPVTSASKTALSVKVPVGATTGPVSVTTPDGTATSAEAFVVSAPNRPVVTSVTPNIAAPGDAVTVGGSSFGERATNLAVVNETRAGVSDETATSLKLWTPGTGASGRVSVTNLEGTGVGPDLFIAPSGFTAADVGPTGRIALGDSRAFTIQSPKKLGLYVLDAAAGQRMYVSAGQASAQIRAVAPDGSQLPSPVDPNEPLTFPKSGTYTIVIDTSAWGGATTSGTLTTVEVPPDQTYEITPTPAGVIKDLEFPVVGQNARFTFEGHAGQNISINGTNVNGIYYVRILKPDGSLLGYNGDWIRPGYPNFYDGAGPERTLPTDGSYTIFLDPQGTSTGSVTLGIYDSTDLERPIAPTPSGGVEDLDLSTPGRNVGLTFEGTAGQRFALHATNSTFSSGQLSIAVRKPDGTILFSSSLTGSAHFFDAAGLPSTGTYTILVNPSGPSTGSVRLTAYDVPADYTDTISPTPEGISRTLTVSTPGQNARVRFTGQAGQSVSVRGTAAGARSQVSIVGPDGAQLGGRSSTFQSSGSLNFYDAERLPADGTYDVLVDPEGAATGTFDITVYDATDASRAITPTPEGLTETLSIVAPGQNGTLRFDAQAGQRVAVKTTSALNQPAWVSIRKPDGTVLGSSQVISQGASGFVDTVTVPTGGTYSVHLDPWNLGTGSAALTVYDVPADVSGTIAPSAAGDTKVAANDFAGQNVRLTFTGTAGQRISFRSSPQSYTPGGSAITKLLRPDGTALRSSQDAWYEPVTLPVSGTYTIVIDPQNWNTGSATVSAWNVPADISTNVTPTAAGGQGTVETTVPGQNGRITFNGTAGQRVFIHVDGETYPNNWTTLVIRRPDGSTFEAFNAEAGGFTNTVTLPTTGQYAVLVDPGHTDTGSITMTVYDVPQDSTASFTPTAAGTQVTATNSVPGQSARLTWNGAAGQRVSLDVTGKSYPDWAYLSILKPDGTVLLNYGNMTSVPRYIDAVTLPTTGTYTILVDPRSKAVGDVTMSVYDVPPDFTDVIGFSAAGESKTVSTSTPGQNAKLTFSGAQGRQASLTAASTTYSSAQVSVQRPDGTNLISPRTVTAPFTFPTTTLPTTGTYTIVVNPDGSATGNMTMSLRDATGGGALAMTTARRSLPGSGGLFSSLVGPRPNGSPAVAVIEGDVVSPAGRPLENVRLGAGRSAARTDARGHFALRLPKRGQRVIDVDGTEAGGFGRLRLRVAATRGQTAMLIDPIFMPQVAPAHRRGRTLTTPRAPGFAVHLEGDGRVREPRVGVGGVGTPPQPLPGNRKALATFSVQWDGRRPKRGARVTYPNLPRLAAGTRVGLWSLDPRTGRWVRYGVGRVTADRSQVVAAAGVLAPHVSLLATSVQPQPRESRKARRRGAHTGRERANTLAWLPRPPVRARARGATRTPRATKAGRQGERTKLPRYRASTPEFWRQSRDRLGRGWASRRPNTPWTGLQPLHADVGVTALSGQALRLNGLPLADVEMQLEGTDATARTDRTGRFLMSDVPAGRHVLVIDGRETGQRGRYGVFEAQVNLERGKTTVLEYDIWMPALSRAGAVELDRPTSGETVVKTPHIPGLEVRVPAGSYVRDRDGKPVRELSITPIPIDRPPFPLPEHVEVPIYFTVQPGGAYLSKGAQIIYPNYNNLPPGQRVDFWQYDPDQRGWHIYGRGTVTPDGERVMPDPDVRVWELTGAMITSTPTPPSTWPFTWLEGGKADGDPVDLSSGLFTLKTTDLRVNDVVPLELTRTYRPNDSNSYAFGIGMTNAYDMRLWTAVYPSYQWADLIMPDGGRVRYTRISPGEGFRDAVFESTTSAGRFYKSTVTWNATDDGWDLRLRDGTVYEMGDEAPLQAIRDRFGNRIEIKRRDMNGLGSGIGPITQLTSTNGRWIKLTYDASNRITRATDNASRSVEYTYNNTGRLATMKNAKGGVTSYGYDKNGRMTTIKDPRNPNAAYVTNTYDANGRVTKQVLADGGIFTYAYTLDSGGRVTKTRVTDPMGRIRDVTFNSVGYPVTEARAVGTPIEQNTTYEREPGTNILKSVTDELGRKTAYQYDDLGNVTQVTRLAGTPEAKTTTFTYEPVESQIASITDPLLHTTSFTYDSLGRLTTIADATDKTVTYGYTDSDSQPDSVTDPAGETTTYEYLAGDLVASTDPLGNETRFFVDNVGRPIVVTDPTGRKTRRSYDDVNQLTKITNPAGQSTSFEHDANGNLTRVTDARNSVTTFTYDSMNRLATRVDGLNRTERFEYDKNGNLTKQTDRKAQVTTLQYDALNRRTFVGYGTAGTTSSPTYASSTSYTYDGANRVTGISDSVAGALTNAHDGLDRLTSQTTSVASVGYGYDAAGRRTSMTVPGQAPVTYGYDDANRPLSIAQGSASVAFGYDAAGRRSSVMLPNGVSENYAYDAASRLTGIAYRQGASLLGDLNYEFDSAGRRTAVWGGYARTGLPQAMGSATYDAANQRTAQDGASLTYDLNGNMTRDASGATFTWNARDQLASTIRGATSASFTYDAAGRRHRKTVNGVSTDYVYDGHNVVQERRGGTPSADLLTGFGIDETFSRTTPAGTSTLLTDALGSTLALTDQFGLPTTTYTYDPFGATSHQGSADNPTQYAGRENDGTGLYHYRNRYYHPGMGRFISEDPIGLAGGDTNLHAYVGNTPLNATDPLGLRAMISGPQGSTDGINAYWAFEVGLHYYASGPILDPLHEDVGWDSYRPCPWGKFAAQDCDSGEDGGIDLPNIGEPLGDAWDWTTDYNSRLGDVDRGIREVGKFVKKPPVRNCLIGGGIVGGLSRSGWGALVGCGGLNVIRRFK